MQPAQGAVILDGLYQLVEFLEGGPGYRYCRLLARYEGFANAELKQLRARRRSPSNS